jgi:hypothetical protein
MQFANEGSKAVDALADFAIARLQFSGLASGLGVGQILPDFSRAFLLRVSWRCSGRAQENGTLLWLLLRFLPPFVPAFNCGIFHLVSSNRCLVWFDCWQRSLVLALINEWGGVAEPVERFANEPG